MMKVNEFLESEEWQCKKKHLHPKFSSEEFSKDMVLVNKHKADGACILGMLTIGEAFRNAFDGVSDFRIVIDFDAETQKVEVRTYKKPDDDYKTTMEIW